MAEQITNSFIFMNFGGLRGDYSVINLIQHITVYPYTHVPQSKVTFFL